MFATDWKANRRSDKATVFRHFNYAQLETQSPINLVYGVVCSVTLQLWQFRLLGLFAVVLWHELNHSNLSDHEHQHGSLTEFCTEKFPESSVGHSPVFQSLPGHRKGFIFSMTAFR